MSNEQKAIEKLTKTYLKITQNLGFSKYYSTMDNEEIKYMKELEKEIRESLELLGYNVNELVTSGIK